MKSPSVSVLLGVSVLLLCGRTVSEVSPNLQQFFREGSVTLSCDDDGWTVKRTKGGKTEQCGVPGSDFGNFNGSSCNISPLSPSDSAGYWCETSSGQRSDQINITVTDSEQVILEVPGLPVTTGSDVTLRCRYKDDNRLPAVSFKNGVKIKSGSGSEFTLRNVQRSDEGLYWCYIDESKPSARSWLRVRAAVTMSNNRATVSLTLTQPELFDSGTYTCAIRGGGAADVLQVTLTVNSKKEQDLRNQVTGVSVAFGVFVVLVAASVGFAYRSGYLRFSKNTGPEDTF